MKTGLITGASRGLGKTLATFLAKQDYRLIITARGREALEQTAQTLRGFTSVTALAGDVRDETHRRTLADASQEGLDLLINNASSLGQQPLPSLANYDLGELRQVVESNFISPIALIQTLLPALEKKRGTVINLSSDAALGGYEGWGGYGASKAALDLASHTLANELREKGVAVMSVDPGDMRTTMHQDAFPNEDISDRPLPDVTLPFWAWLLGQDPFTLSGQRFQAQADIWTVAGGTR